MAGGNFTGAPINKDSIEKFYYYLTFEHDGHIESNALLAEKEGAGLSSLV